MAASSTRIRFAGLLAVGIVCLGSAVAAAKPITKVGELIDWEPGKKADLPKSLADVDPNTLIMAKDTLDVLPDMFVKMETVILNLTDEGNVARLNELYASIQADAEAERKQAKPVVQAFAIDLIRAELEKSDATMPLEELEVLTEEVEGGPVKQLVKDLAKQGPAVKLADLLDRVEKGNDEVKGFYRDVVLEQLEKGHPSSSRAWISGEAYDDPWSVPIPELRARAPAGPEAVQTYVKHLPVWIAHHRVEMEAPDIPINQLLLMLAGSHNAYQKMLDRPLVEEKDLQAPTKVAYSLQEVYARSEQINMGLIGRHVTGVVAVATLLLLLSALRGYIRLLNIPNVRIVSKAGEEA